MPIPEVLCEQSGFGEILWNFSRFKDEKKRLSLRQHPQFYETLPTLPKEYGAEFRRDPTETFLVEKQAQLGWPGVSRNRSEQAGLWQRLDPKQCYHFQRFVPF
jgi:hypothetical protein